MTMHLILFLAGLVAVVLAGAALFTWRTARRIETFMPPGGRFIDVPGARLHVREAGSGPAILLVHGLAGQLAHYNYGVLEELARDYRVIAVDRPGSGYSTRSTPADLATQAAALSALIATLGLGKPLVVGHSLGGALALKLAHDHPQRVGALALIAPFTHTPKDYPKVFEALTIRSLFMRKLVAWTMATPASIARSAKVLPVIFGPEPVPADFATKGGGLHSLRPSQFLAASADMQALPEVMPELEQRYAELRLPVRVLFAKGDRLLDWQANGQALVDKVPGATLTVVEGGHMLPITQPEETTSFIRNVAEELFGPAEAQKTAS
jgi:pimeloyl-ACP methyl ester carboxylesterase